MRRVYPLTLQNSARPGVRQTRDLHLKKLQDTLQSTSWKQIRNYYPVIIQKGWYIFHKGYFYTSNLMSITHQLLTL